MAKQINLVNPLLQTQKTAFSAHNMAQALGLVLGGMLIFYGYAYFTVLRLQWRNSSAEGAVYEETRKLQKATEEIQKRTQNPKLQADVRDYEIKLAGQSSLLAVVNSETLANIDNARLYSGYLSGLARQSVPGLWLTEIRVTGNTGALSLKGRVTDPAMLPEYLKRLGRESALSGRKFTVMDLRESGQIALTAGNDQRVGYFDFTLRDTENK